MGFSPREVDAMTVYELSFLQSSYAKAHGLDKDAAPSDEDFFERTGVA
jgi:hypothetical protein